MTSAETPAVARRRLRLALRRARDAKGLTQQQVADELFWSLSKVNRIESGDVTISITDLRALLNLLDVRDPGTVERLTEDARAARRRGWWDEPQYREHLTSAMIQLLQFEAEASEIRMFEPGLVSGLLQTRSYAEAVLDYFSELVDDTRSARLEIRMIRAQHLLDRTETPPTYLVLLDESVLIRSVGGLRVLAEQLERLAMLCDRDNVIIRIAPLAESAMALLGTFMLLQLDEGNEILYKEDFMGDELVHASGQVALYRERFERLWHQALEPDVSKRLIEARKAELLSILDRQG